MSTGVTTTSSSSRAAAEAAAAAAAAAVSSSDRLEFVSVKEGRKEMDTVQSVYTNALAPLCGDQSANLAAIRERSRIRCELLTQNERPVGLITYQKEPVGDSFIFKAFTVIDLNRNSGKGYGSDLVKRIVRLAQRVQAKKVRIDLPVNATAARTFLIKKGFVAGTGIADPNVPGGQKHPFSLNVPETKRKRTESKEPNKESNGGAADSSTKRARTGDPQSVPPDKKPPAPSSSQSVNDAKAAYGYGYHYSSSSGGGGGGAAGHYAYSYSGGAYGAPSTQRAAAASPRPMEVTLKKKYVNQIQSGRKTVEGRINSGMFRGIQAGTRIRFFYKQNQRDDAVCEVLSVQKYTSFREMLEQEGFQNCLTDVHSLEQAVGEYDRIPGYAQRAAQSGVLAIRVKLIEQR